MSLANSDLMPAIGGVGLPLLGSSPVVRKNSDDCLRALYTDCKVLESQLQKSKYLVGDRLTLADYFTVSTFMLAFMIYHQVLREKYPRLTEWFNEVWEMPVFKDVAGDLHLLNVPAPPWPEDQA